MTKRFRRGSIVAAAALALASCGRGSPEAAEASHEERDAALAASLANESSADPQNPFKSAQTLAEDSMGAAVGSNLDQTWVRMMIEHQEGAARFSDILLRTNPPVAVRAMAERMKHDAHKRISALEQVREASLHPDASTLDAFGRTVPETFSRMTQLQGANLSQTWALKVASYNRGAVSLSGIEITRGKDERVRSLARQLAWALANEEDQLEHLAATTR